MAICKNNKAKTIKEDKDVSFLSFPTDTRRKQWVIQLRFEHFTEKTILSFTLQVWHNQQGKQKKTLKCGKDNNIT